MCTHVQLPEGGRLLGGTGLRYEFPSGVTGNQCGSAAVCAGNPDTAEV